MKEKPNILIQKPFSRETNRDQTRHAYMLPAALNK